MNDARTLELSEGTASAATATRGPWHVDWRLLTAPPLFARYVLISGAIGVPLSILQLLVLLFVYESYAGDAGVIALNALWLANFEIGLMRNYALHCAYTWRMAPSWRGAGHAHVAATGAIIVDLIAFNAIVAATGIIPLAQLFGAASGFGLNFLYNRSLTFARARGVLKESMP